MAGRDNACDIVLSDGGISREHAIFQDDGDQLTVTDVASTNGTFVNGRQISSATVVNPGDIIRMGGCELEYVGRKPQSEFPSYRDTRENLPVEMSQDAGRYVARPMANTVPLKRKVHS